MIRVFIVIPLLLIGGISFSQTPLSFNNLTDSAKQVYHEAAYHKYDYVNGREYKAYYNPLQTTPILEAMMSTGTIYHNGFEYPGLILGYDTNIDELIAIPHMYTKYIQMNKSAVDSFLIKLKSKSYFFKNLTFKNNTLPNGYYEIAYKGRSTLIIKHTSVVLIDEGITTYTPKMLNYLIKDDKIYPITKKKDLLCLYEDHKKLIKKRIRQNLTSYKNLSSNQLTDLIRYIESL